MLLDGIVANALPEATRQFAEDPDNRISFQVRNLRRHRAW